MAHLAEALTRPNGKLYRPRYTFLRARSWDNDHLGRDGCGVIVFGTLNPERARSFAHVMCRQWFELPVADRPAPEAGWWRDTFRWGERTWAYDELRGAPGVLFWAATE